MYCQQNLPWVAVAKLLHSEIRIPHTASDGGMRKREQETKAEHSDWCRAAVGSQQRGIKTKTAEVNLLAEMVGLHA